MASLYTTCTRYICTFSYFFGLFGCDRRTANSTVSDSNQGDGTYPRCSFTNKKQKSKPTSTHLSSVGWALRTHLRTQVHSVTSPCFLSWRNEHLFSLLSFHSPGFLSASVWGTWHQLQKEAASLLVRRIGSFGPKPQSDLRWPSHHPSFSLSVFPLWLNDTTQIHETRPYRLTLSCWGISFEDATFQFSLIFTAIWKEMWFCWNEIKPF